MKDNLIMFTWEILALITVFTLPTFVLLLYLVCSVGFYFWFYYMWRFNNKTILNPRLSIVGIIVSLWLIIVMIVGFITK